MRHRINLLSVVALFSFHNLCLGNQVIFKNFVNTCPIQNFMYVFTALKKLLKYNYPLDPIISKAPYNYSKQFHPYWNCNSIAVSLNHCWLEAHGTLHITMYWWTLNICVCKSWKYNLLPSTTFCWTWCHFVCRRLLIMYPPILSHFRIS